MYLFEVTLRLSSVARMSHWGMRSRCLMSSSSPAWTGRLLSEMFGEGEGEIGGGRREVLERAGRQGFVRATGLQEWAAGPVGEGRSVVLAAETGAGKTLAYLLPLLWRAASLPAAPLLPVAVLLAPSPELCAQIHAVASSLLPPALSAAALHGADLRRLLAPLCRPSPNRSPDRPPSKLPTLLITDPLSLRRALSLLPPSASPSALARRSPLLGRGRVAHPLLSSRPCLVLDEADLLLSGHLLPVISDLLTAFRKASSPSSALSLSASSDGATTNLKQQLIFVGATFPNAAQSFIRKHAPSAEWLRSERLHCTPLPPSGQRWAAVAGSEERLQLLEDLAREALSGQQHLLIFANTLRSAQHISERLQGAGLAHQLCHGEMPPSSRLSALDAWRSSPSAVLVCTSLLSRGLDPLLPSPTSSLHVVQADFALSAVDYIHRVGRVIRLQPASASSSSSSPTYTHGLVTNIFLPEAADLVNEIRATPDGQPLTHAFSRAGSFRRKLHRRDASAARAVARASAGDSPLPPPPPPPPGFESIVPGHKK